MSRTLVVTNDFPTRQGGIESFVYALADRLPTDEVVVYTASMPGDREFDERTNRRRWRRGESPTCFGPRAVTRFSSERPLLSDCSPRGYGQQARSAW